MAATASADTSERRRPRITGRRGPAQQTELLSDERPGALVGTPTWQNLPAATQAVLTSLMARLILGHVEARRAGLVAEAGHDL